jgi:hypothetical protein
MNQALDIYFRFQRELEYKEVGDESYSIAATLTLAQCIANAGNDLSDIGPAIEKVALRIAQK